MTNGQIMRFDGVALKDSLSARGDIKRAKVLSRYIDAQSASADLSEAEAKLVLCVNLVSSGPIANRSPILQDEDSAHICGALFARALTLYATVATNNDRRRKIEVTKGWSASEIAEHSRTLELRHQAIAHFGNPITTGRWRSSKDELVLIFEDQCFSSTVIYQRSNYNAAAVVDLRECLTRAIAAIPAIVEQRWADADAMLRDWHDTDFDSFDALLTECRIDPEDEGYSEIAKSCVRGASTPRTSYITAINISAECAPMVC